MRRTSSTKGAKARADKYFSLIVRSRGACENCSLRTNLQCAIAKVDWQTVADELAASWKTLVA